MKKICPICKKPVKRTQSQANIPVGEDKGLVKTVLCHLDCVAKLSKKELAEMFPYFYELIKEGGQEDLPPFEEGEVRGVRN